MKWKASKNVMWVLNEVFGGGNENDNENENGLRRTRMDMDGGPQADFVGERKLFAHCLLIAELIKLRKFFTHSIFSAVFIKLKQVSEIIRKLKKIILV